MGSTFRALLTAPLLVIALTLVGPTPQAHAQAAAARAYQGAQRLAKVVDAGRTLTPLDVIQTIRARPYLLQDPAVLDLVTAFQNGTLDDSTRAFLEARPMLGEAIEALIEQRYVDGTRQTLATMQRNTVSGRMTSSSALPLAVFGDSDAQTRGLQRLIETYRARSRFASNANTIASGIISQPGFLQDNDVLTLLAGWRDGTLQLSTLETLSQEPEAAFALRLVAHRAGFGVDSPFHLEEMRAKAGRAVQADTLASLRELIQEKRARGRNATQIAHWLLVQGRIAENPLYYVLLEDWRLGLLDEKTLLEIWRDPFLAEVMEAALRTAGKSGQFYTPGADTLRRYARRVGGYESLRHRFDARNRLALNAITYLERYLPSDDPSILADALRGVPVYAIRGDVRALVAGWRSGVLSEAVMQQLRLSPRTRAALPLLEVHPVVRPGPLELLDDNFSSFAATQNYDTRVMRTDARQRVYEEGLKRLMERMEDYKGDGSTNNVPELLARLQDDNVLEDPAVRALLVGARGGESSELPLPMAERLLHHSKTAWLVDALIEPPPEHAVFTRGGWVVRDPLKHYGAFEYSQTVSGRMMRPAAGAAGGCASSRICTLSDLAAHVNAARRTPGTVAEQVDDMGEMLHSYEWREHDLFDYERDLGPQFINSLVLMGKGHWIDIGADQALAIRQYYGDARFSTKGRVTALSITKPTDAEYRTFERRAGRHGFRHFEGYVEDLPPGQIGQADVITDRFSSLWYTADPRKTLGAIAALLKEGGKLHTSFDPRFMIIRNGQVVTFMEYLQEVKGLTVTEVRPGFYGGGVQITVERTGEAFAAPELEAKYMGSDLPPLRIFEWK